MAQCPLLLQAMTIPSPLCLACLLFAVGCSSVGLVRVEQAEPRSGAPSIARLVDLGVAPLPTAGPLDAKESDKVFTPGEWLAVVGENLDATSTVAVDGRPIPVEGYLKGGSLLLRVPRGFSPRTVHQLVVTTKAGSAAMPLSISSYVIVASPNGNSLALLPLSPETKGTLDLSPKELEVEWARGHALSPDGGWLYIIESPQSETNPATQAATYPARLRAFQLGAPSGPRPAWETRVVLACAPTALAMLGPERIAVLGERELVVMDVTPGRVRELGRASLTGPRSEVLFTDIVAINQGRAAILLETLGNHLLLVDLAGAPRLVADLTLAEGQDTPIAVDLAKDDADDSAAWVLLGPNIRIGTEKARRAIATLAGTDDGKKSGKKGPVKPVPRLVLKVRGQASGLETLETRKLPDGFNPLHLSCQPTGELYVSGVNSEVFGFSGLDASRDGASKALSILGDSLQMGRIIKMARDGSVTTLVQGTALYFNMDMVPDVGLAYFTWRLGVGGFPPGPRIKWGVELDGGFSDFGAMDWKAIIPPYAFSIFATQ